MGANIYTAGDWYTTSTGKSFAPVNAAVDKATQLIGGNKPQSSTGPNNKADNKSNVPKPEEARKTTPGNPNFFDPTFKTFKNND